MRAAVRLPARASAAREPAAVARAVRTALRRPDLVAGHAEGARVFYDCEHGLRVLAVTDTIWGEVWVSGPRSRRATVHSGLHPAARVDLEFRVEDSGGDGYEADSEDEYDGLLRGALYIVGQDWPEPPPLPADLRQAVDHLFAVDYD